MVQNYFFHMYEKVIDAYEYDMNKTFLFSELWVNLYYEITSDCRIFHTYMNNSMNEIPWLLS